MNRQKTLDSLFASGKPLLSEDDCAENIVVPFLDYLGHNTIQRKVTIKVPSGENKLYRQADIVVISGKKPKMVVETKRLSHRLDDEDTSQVLAYAELLDCRFAVLTNGKHWEFYDRESVGLGGLTDIPDAAGLGASSWGRPVNLDARQRLAARLVYTLENKDKLSIAFENAREALARHGLIAGEAFDELTKLLVCKFNEERNQAAIGKESRFKASWVEAEGWMPGLRKLFFDAAKTFRVFPKNADFAFNDNGLATDLVMGLEPFGFVGASGPVGLLGAGGDVIGSVYEKFLSGTLKGELGQYLTPRPIVDFMVDVASPTVGERVLDLSCGSGGFLIRSFLQVRKLIQGLPLGEKEKNEKIQDLVTNHLWGVEVNPRLANLCRINLVLHGDGFNNIYAGDSVGTAPVISAERSINLADYEHDAMPKFDVILMNPPFNRPYNDEEVLAQYHLGRGRSSQGSDWLMLERALRLLSDTGRLVIVLPYRVVAGVEQQHVRDFLFANTYIAGCISLPVGAFKPFGGSNARTVILVIQKKKPARRILARADYLGYDLGSETFRPVQDRDDLGSIARYFSDHHAVIDPLALSVPPDSHMLDAGMAQAEISRKGSKGKSKALKQLVQIASEPVNPRSKKHGNTVFQYLDLGEVDEALGVITSYRELQGNEIGSTKTRFQYKDILFAKIRPSIDNKKVGFVFQEFENGVASTEFIVLRAKKDLSIEDIYYLFAAIRADAFTGQVIAACGGDTGRQRVPPGKLLECHVPWPDPKIRAQIGAAVRGYFESINNTLELRQLVQSAGLPHLGQTSFKTNKPRRLPTKRGSGKSERGSASRASKERSKKVTH